MSNHKTMHKVIPGDILIIPGIGMTYEVEVTDIRFDGGYAIVTDSNGGIRVFSEYASYVAREQTTDRHYYEKLAREQERLAYHHIEMAQGYCDISYRRAVHEVMSEDCAKAAADMYERAANCKR